MWQAVCFLCSRSRTFLLFHINTCYRCYEGHTGCHSLNFFISFQTKGLIKLQQNKITSWNLVEEMTVNESKVIIYGRRKKRGPYSLYVLQNDQTNKMIIREINSPCPHDSFITSLFTLAIQSRELLAVLCNVCNDIKLVDIETKQATIVFKSPTDPPWRMCSGPDGVVFVCSGSCQILELNSYFNTTKRLNTQVKQCLSICHLPAPHDALVIQSNYQEVTAMSLRGGNQLWRKIYRGYSPTNFVFNQDHNVLLTSDTKKPEVLILDPSSGEVLQTIAVEHVCSILAMSNNKVVMLQEEDDSKDNRILSSYSLKSCSRVNSHNNRWRSCFNNL